MEWLVKQKHVRNSEFGGELMILEYGGERPHTVFRFLKNSVYKICSSDNYMFVAREGSRIYFKGTDSPTGFKLRKTGNSIREIKIKKELLTLDASELGEYNIEYDSKEGLNYIDFNRKLSKQLSWTGEIR